MTRAERISDAHTMACNAAIAAEAVEVIAMSAGNYQMIERLALLASDQARRAMDLLQPFVDGEVAA